MAEKRATDAQKAEKLARKEYKQLVDRYLARTDQEVDAINKASKFS